MTSEDELRAAETYARFLCIARIAQQGADKLYQLTLPENCPALDAIKRVMEIDTELVNSKVVLMRAGVMMLKEDET